MKKVSFEYFSIVNVKSMPDILKLRVIFKIGIYIFYIQSDHLEEKYRK